MICFQQPFDRMPPKTNECCHFLDILYRVHFLSLARSELKQCSANHRPGYWSNMSCDWLSTARAHSQQETENGPRSSGKHQTYFLASKTDKKFCCNWVTELKSGHKMNYSKDTSCHAIMSVIVNAQNKIAILGRDCFNWLPGHVQLSTKLCCEATSHYLNQHWPHSVMPYGHKQQRGKWQCLWHGNFMCNTLARV